MTRTRAVVHVVCLALAPACGGVPLPVASPPAPRADTMAADAARAHGCLLCLREAEAAYLALGARAPEPRLARLFETQLLLAVRSRELGLEADPVFDRARATARALPASRQAEMYLRIADAIPPEPDAVSRAEEQEFRIARRVPASQVSDWLAFLEAGPASPDVNASLAVALACARSPDTVVGAVVDRVVAQHPASLLVKYAVGACRATSARLLEDARAAEPRFGEASLFLGRYAMARLGGIEPRRTSEWLDEAYRTLPDVPAVTFTIAGLHSLRRDWPNVLRFSDETIARSPRHADAWIGRVTALSRLGRHEEAVAAATAILDTLAAEHGAALYWRGWNEYQLGQLAAARDDADAASRLAVNTDIETLAGVVAFDQQRFTDARAHLREARRLDGANCGAAWHLGRTESALASWDAAAPAFVAAVTCYDTAVEQLRAELETLRHADDRPADLRDRQVVEGERTIVQTRMQALAAAFNAGWSLVQARHAADAVPYLRRALEHPDLHDRASQLLRDLAPR